MLRYLFGLFGLMVLSAVVATVVIYVCTPLRDLALGFLFEEGDFKLLALKVWGLGVVVMMLGVLVRRCL